MFISVAVCLSFFASVQAKTYYVSTSGNDQNSGQSVKAPWKTIDKVNSVQFLPGDKILFKRGDMWVGSSTSVLIPRSGSDKGYVAYGAYGKGEKPVLTEAKIRSAPEEWVNEGGNIWSTGGAVTLSDDLLGKAFGQQCFYANGENLADASATGCDFSSAAEIKVKRRGKVDSDIQLYTKPFLVEHGKYYELTFRAKSTIPFKFQKIALQEAVYPWVDFYANYAMMPGLETAWTTSTVVFISNVDSKKANIRFYLGTSTPEGAQISIAGVSVREISPDSSLYTDIANVMFDDVGQVGTKVWNRESLDGQGKFWYDIENKRLKIYSAENPAIYYGRIYLVLKESAVDESHKKYVVYDGLHFSMANHGISGDDVHHITVKNCDFSYLGGGDVYMDGERHLRLGNGVEFYNSSHDTLVADNRFWQIYDAAMTTQGLSISEKYNQYFLNNLVWNTQYGIEHWLEPASSSMRDIYYENNTIVNSGGGWGNSQRPDGGNGRAFLSYGNTAKNSNIFVRNNAFINATESIFESWNTGWFSGLVAGYNFYHNKFGPLFQIHSASSSLSLAGWQEDAVEEIGSIASDQHPKMSGIQTNNFVPDFDSALVDAGMHLGKKSDFLGNPIYGAPDIGAYEFQPPYLMGKNKIDVGAGARIYADGKFRYLSEPTKVYANLIVKPITGKFKIFTAGEARPAWLDVEGIVWTSSTKKWIVNTKSKILQTIGDLKPKSKYEVLVDGKKNGEVSCYNSCKSDKSGKITFVFNGSGKHEFEVKK